MGQSLKGEDVVAVMQHLHQELDLVPKRIQVANGSEFISKALDRWAYDQHVTLDFSRPGKPTDNPYIAGEAYNWTTLFTPGRARASRQPGLGLVGTPRTGLAAQKKPTRY